MNVVDLKNQLLTTIESSSMQTMFPKFCGTFYTIIEQTEASNSDADALKLFIEIFKNPDEWLAFLAEQTSDSKTE